MTNESDQNLRELDGFGGDPVTVLVGGNLYSMGLLEPADFVAAAQWRAEQKGKIILDTIPSNPLVDVAAIKAEAWAAVLDKPVDPWKLMSDTHGVVRLAWIATRRGGQFKGPPDEAGFEYFRTHLPPGGYKDLEQAVFKVSGFYVAKRNSKDAVSGNPPVEVPASQ